MLSPIDRARRYVAALPPSVSGAGGDTALLKAAQSLVRGFSLSPQEAFPLLAEYNARAVPPWPESALRSKLTTACRSTLPDGYLLATDRPHTATRPPARPVTTPPPTAKPSSSRRPRRNDRRFRLPTRAEVETIAGLRGVDPSTVEMLVDSGLLCMAPRRGFPAWWLVDGNIAQARRLDGEKWTFSDGSTGKTANDGPLDAFGISMGVHEDTRLAIVTEGLASILESLECLRRYAAGRGGRWAEDVGLVAAWGAGANFLERKADADMLAVLRQCAVLVVADPGEAGERAAVRWYHQLTAAGCEQITLICPVEGDLGDNLRAFPNCPQTIIDFLEPRTPAAPGGTGKPTNTTRQ